MTDTTQIAQVFLAARRHGQALGSFPGDQPATLAEAYAVQGAALAMGSAPQPGWKVAAIRPDLRDRLGAVRLSGPIMALIDARGAGVADAPVIEGGFAAVEAEFLFHLARDIVPGATPDDLLAAVGALHVGVEVAGSPLASLSDLGPTAVIADHGNNAAVVIGDAVPDWQALPVEALTSRVTINGAVVGEGGAARLPAGGPLASLAWLADHLAQRGRGLKAGDWVATGATTGVHRVAPGDVALIEFGPRRITLTITAQRTTDEGRPA